MSKFGLLILLILMAGTAVAQNYSPSNDRSSNPKDGSNYFVLITADSSQAFYVRVDSEARNSTAGGHLILAPLRDGAYVITIGFPGQVYPEQRFVLNINKRDRSLALSRRNGAWNLYDRKGQALPNAPDPLASEKRLVAGVKKDDAFSRMMSEIVRDTAVMYNNYATGTDGSTASATGPSHPDSGRRADDSGRRADDSGRRADDSGSLASALPPTHDSSPASGLPATHDSSAGPVRLGNVPSSPTGVMKLSEVRSTRSLRLLYADRSSSRSTDTVDVVIPVESLDRRDSLSRPDSSRPDSPTSRPDSPTSRPDSPTVRNRRLLFINSDCHAYATAYDVDRLKARMLESPRDADRTLLARKAFKTKCFSTAQIRTLSQVYATQAAKFKFVEAAYPFVSDARFPELINLFSDPAYGGKFRTLTNGH